MNSDQNMQPEELRAARAKAAVATATAKKIWTTPVIKTLDLKDLTSGGPNSPSTDAAHKS